MEEKEQILYESEEKEQIIQEEEGNTQNLQEEAIEYVNNIASWSRFFAIVQTIFLSIYAISGISYIIKGLTYERPYDYWNLSYGRDLSGDYLKNGFIHLVVVAIVVPMIVLLFRTANNATASFYKKNNEEFLKFIKHTETYWIYSTIVTIIAFGVTLLTNVL